MGTPGGPPRPAPKGGGEGEAHKKRRAPGGQGHEAAVGEAHADAHEGPKEDGKKHPLPFAKGQEPRQGHHQGEGDAHPRLLGKPPAGPSRRVQNRGDVRDGGHGDPAQVEAEGRVHKPALPGTRGPQPTPQVEVDGDEGGQKRAHGHEGEGKPLVVPEEDPGRIGQVGGEEPGAHPGQPGVLLTAGRSW